MRIDVLTLFPEMVEPVLSGSILGRARAAGLLDVRTAQLRDWTTHRQRMTDDYPFGGGAGMVMYAQPIVDAVQALDPGHAARRIYLSPRGRTLTQRVAEELAGEERLLLLCGHYEGVDQRALDMCGFEELSIGDYVLTGGELGALVVIDAVARLLPGVLGSDESSRDESFTTGLLEYPQYTRPASFRGMNVPDVLLQGNHADIHRWRMEQSLRLTLERRPDLLGDAPADEDARDMLARLCAGADAVEAIAARGVNAECASLAEADAFPKHWIEAFIPEQNRKAAKRACSYDRQLKYFHRAFERGLVPGAADAPDDVELRLIYLPEKRVLIRLAEGSAEGLGDRVEIDETWTRTRVVKGNRTWFAAKQEVSE